MDGDHLFQIVQEYADFGDHRTGSPVGQATAAWMAAQLEQRGLTAVTEPVPFDNWIGSSVVEADGQLIPSLALPFEWTGDLTTNTVTVSSVDPQFGGFPKALDDSIVAAKKSGDAAVVLCTEHPAGSLVAINRQLGSETSDFPTVLAAGRDHALLAAANDRGRVTLQIDGRREPGATTNVIAMNAAAQADPSSALLITTPLNGWFSCAGERGTGIAVTLDLAERFAAMPLIVVATGGHELGWFGAHEWVEATTIVPRVAVHVGASVAVDTPIQPGGPRDLVTTRMALISLNDAAAVDVAAALEPAGLQLTCSVTAWVGEGDAFCKLGSPLLSFSGMGPHFHTPEDHPDVATSPDALATVADAFAKAITALLAAVPA